MQYKDAHANLMVNGDSSECCNEEGLHPFSCRRHFAITRDSNTVNQRAWSSLHIKSDFLIFAERLNALLASTSEPRTKNQWIIATMRSIKLPCATLLPSRRINTAPSRLGRLEIYFHFANFRLWWFPKFKCLSLNNVDRSFDKQIQNGIRFYTLQPLSI